MPWSAISTDEVMGELTPVELATLQNIQGTTDAISAVLDRTVGMARGCIQAGGNALGAAGTVPDQLRADIIALARWKWLISFPKLKSMQTDERKQAGKDAEDLLQLIASQKADRPRVENPDGTTPLTAPAIKPSHRHMSRRQQEGL